MSERVTMTMQEVSTILDGRDGIISFGAKGIVKELADPANRSKTGTVKAWFQAHHGAVVDSVLSSPGSVWARDSRAIDSRSKAGEALLDGSAMEYRGKVLHADADTLLFSYDFGGECWALYTVVG